MNGRQRSRPIEVYMKFFGMCNSPATFQAMMDRTFEDIVEGGFVLIYMDDILIFAQSKEYLEQLTKQVLQ